VSILSGHPDAGRCVPRAPSLPLSPQTFGKGANKVKQYHHYAYKMEAAAPFRICAVSEELTLVTRKKDPNSQKRCGSARAAECLGWEQWCSHRRGTIPIDSAPSQHGRGRARSSSREPLCRTASLTACPPPPLPPRDWTHQRIWKDTSQTAYVAGLFVDGSHVLISYGSSDIDARLLTMSVGDIEGLFPRPFDCSSAEVLDAGSGEALPAVLAVSGGSPGGAADNSTDTARHKQHRRAHHKGP
jgi:hypothetical protein